MHSHHKRNTPDFSRSAKVYLGLVSADLKLGRYEQAFEIMRRGLQAAADVGRSSADGEFDAPVGRISGGRRTLSEVRHRPIADR